MRLLEETSLEFEGNKAETQRQPIIDLII
jgi:hypothetical protein